jgi:hypothetical protein
VLLLLEEADYLVARPATPWDRILARLQARRLDAELAGGASPDASAVLALRAHKLAQESFRRRLARNAQLIMAEATQLRVGRRLPVTACRDRVRTASAEFAELIRCLLAPGPVPVEGVAQVSVLLGDGCGPLYHRGSPDDLRARLRQAAATLSRPPGS